MDLDVQKMANVGVRGLRPYQPGKPITELQRELNLSRVIKLASNENPFGPSAKTTEVIANNISSLNRYPDGAAFEFKHKLADKLKIQAQQITMGNGSDEIFTLVLQAFATSADADEVIISEYAFAAYKIAAKAMGLKVVITPAKGWGHDLTAMAAMVTARTKVIFIANPNNPTGTWNARQQLEDFLAAVPQTTLIVVDQAYLEYMQRTSEYPNALDYLGQYPNLIVTGTFSKIYGLAGLRIGYGISSSKIADILNRVRLPFNANALALAAAECALDDREHIEKTIANNNAGLLFWQQALENLKLQYITASCNFITVNCNQNLDGDNNKGSNDKGDNNKGNNNGNNIADKIYRLLLQQGLIIRPLTAYNMPEYCRISIGLPAENQQAVNILTKVLTKI